MSKVVSNREYRRSIDKAVPSQTTEVTANVDTLAAVVNQIQDFHLLFPILVDIDKANTKRVSFLLGLTPEEIERKKSTPVETVVEIMNNQRPACIMHLLMQSYGPDEIDPVWIEQIKATNIPGSYILLSENSIGEIEVFVPEINTEDNNSES